VTDDLATMATESIADRAANTSAGGYVWTDGEYDSRMRHREPLLAAGVLDLTRQLAEARAALVEQQAGNERLRETYKNVSLLHADRAGRMDDLTRQLAEARAEIEQLHERVQDTANAWTADLNTRVAAIAKAARVLPIIEALRCGEDCDQLGRFKVFREDAPSLFTADDGNALHLTEAIKRAVGAKP